MSLDPAAFRPQGIETIYRRDIDLSVTKEHISEQSPAIGKALKDGVISMSIREPTQTKMAAIVVDMPNFDMSLEELTRVLGGATRNMGYTPGAANIDFANKTAEVPIEMYSESAFVRQVTYSVASLAP